ncbi:MAG: phosphatidate cytidylyltransferase [Frankiales bacterium]|nr:phosphatidate cytidylyltransferase [Frankiales bacterium]
MGTPGDAVEHALEAIDQAPAPPEGAPATHTPGRAGRNLPVATAVGLAMAAIVLIPLFTVRSAFVVVVGLAACLGLYELSSALATDHRRVPLPPLWLGSAIMLSLAWSKGTDDLVIAFLLTAVAGCLWRLVDGAAGYLRDVAATIFALVYVPLLASFAVLLAVPPDGARRVVAFAATVACSDIGGYAAGVLTGGRHAMAPTISPKKSWEGFAGSVTACLGGGLLFVTVLLHAAWWQGVLYGLAVVCAATVGDLGESMIKRDLSIKDMGTLLPGHGGLMDRLDSLLPTAPVAWYLLTKFVPPSHGGH